MANSSPSFWQALKRGFRCKCPSCGKGATFRSYLKVQDHCPKCETSLSHYRADDLPPYITILLVGHIVVPILLLIEQKTPQPIELILPIALVATSVLTFSLLPIIKGGVIALMWHLDKDNSLYN